MIRRRLAYGFMAFLLVVATALTVGAAITLPVSGTSATYYQCVNAAGTAEASRAGLAPPSCAHANDRIPRWPVDLPGPTTTTAVATTTRQSTSTSAAVTTTSGAPLPSSTTVPPSGLWRPTSAHSLSWDWVIGAKPSTAENVQVMDMDGFDNTAADVAAFHAHGTKVICYIDLGTAEPGRPDLNLIPAADRGSSVQGFATEKWLNVADLAGLKPMIDSRVAMCAARGYDAVEPDDIDGYANPTGFPLTAQNQLTYNEYIASAVHAAGMSVLLKNDVDQLATLQPFFDFALNEQCGEFSECGGYSAFTGAGKAVFEAEYSTVDLNCSMAAAGHRNAALFDINLDGSGHVACPSW